MEAILAKFKQHTGPLPRVLMPGVYEVFVRAMDDWEWGSQDCGNLWPSKGRAKRRAPGVVLVCDDELVHEYVEIAFEHIEMGCDVCGGWGPARSARVRWVISRNCFDYKCGDSGVFDIKMMRPKSTLAPDLSFLRQQVAHFCMLARFYEHTKYKHMDGVHEAVAKLIDFEWVHYWCIHYYWHPEDYPGASPPEAWHRLEQWLSCM